MKVRILICLLLLSSWTIAQMPITHLYAFQWSGDSNLIQEPKLCSGHNLNGYNNQPHFITKDEILLSMAWHVDDQVDIYKLNLKEHDLTPITNTSSFEYSPQVTSLGYSCIRVDSNEKQWLWAYPLDGSHQGMTSWKENQTVGYYEWISEDSVCVFLTGTPNKLALVNTKTNKVYRFTSNIGRTFKVQGKKVYYVHKMTEQSWYIKRYDAALKRSMIITKTIEGVEDFHMLADGSLLMAKGAVIFKYDKVKNEWASWLDLSDFGLSSITRINSNEKYLLCVDRQP